MAPLMSSITSKNSIIKNNGAIFILYTLIFIILAIVVVEKFCAITDIINEIVGIFSFIAISITGIYVIKYWEEAQKTKEEIIVQNKIGFQNLKASLLPLVFVELQHYNYPPGSNSPVYDLYLNNRGKGPAFKIIFRRQAEQRQFCQANAVHNVSGQPLTTPLKTIDFLGAGDRIKLFTERSDSYQQMTLSVRYADIFYDWHDVVFKGNRDHIALIEYPTIPNYYDQKPWPTPKSTPIPDENKN